MSFLTPTHAFNAWRTAEKEQRHAMERLKYTQGLDWAGVLSMLALYDSAIANSADVAADIMVWARNATGEDPRVEVQVGQFQALLEGIGAVAKVGKSQEYDAAQLQETVSDHVRDLIYTTSKIIKENRGHSTA